MELKDRIAAVRKAAGLTQEQLGELLGVTRQAVSKWESGQTVPDTATVARLCRELHVSADYVLLGREPEEDDAPEGGGEDDAGADGGEVLCPCCGRSVPGSLCTVCGYPLPTRPPRGPRYAVINCTGRLFSQPRPEALEQYCGLDRAHAEMMVNQSREYGTHTLLRRNLTDSAAQYMAAHLQPDGFSVRIVLDEGETDEALITKPSAMEVTAASAASASGSQQGGLGFWGVVGAVIVALLILSFF